MLADFLFDKCTIFTRTISLVNGEESFTTTNVYSNIPCQYSTANNYTSETNINLNDNLFKLKVIIEGNKINVRSGQYITVSDEVLGEVGTFVIGTAKAKKNIAGDVDHIVLYLKERND